MKPTQPALGIMCTNDYNDVKSYRASCTCGDAAHDHNIWVERDSCGEISVTIFTQVTTPFWSMNRLKQIWALLTTGSITQEATILMDQQQALNYGTALIGAIECMTEIKTSTTT